MNAHAATMAVGVGAGLSLAGVVRTAGGPIVAWGDSLTYGAGADEPASESYPAVAAALLGRRHVNLGIGAQSSTQIAARQGGVPIAVTLDGDALPAATGTALSFGFDVAGDVQGWTNYPSATIEANGGKLLVTVAEDFHAAQIELPDTLPAGRKLIIRADIALIDGAGPVRMVLTDAAHANYSFDRPAVDGWNQWIAEGESDVRFVVFYLPEPGSFTLDNVEIWYTDADVPEVDVTAKSVNILFNSGSFTGQSIGTLGGVIGVMSTDTEGDWTFRRFGDGGPMSVPAGTLFVPGEAIKYRGNAQWLWTGRNNVLDPATIEADIAAMVTFAGHGDYRVLGLLAGSGDDSGTVAMIAALNEELATTYASRFVDALALLQAAGDGSANDLDDIAAGWVPRSLRADHIHLNAAGYALVAAAVAASM